jgi:hypothetical protein
VPGHISCSYGTFTGTEHSTFNAEAGQSVQIRYDVTVHKGEVTICLLDPAGQTLWTASFNHGECGWYEVPLGETGLHRLEVNGERTGGAFTVDWEVVDAS